uniref:SNRNP25 ubiquitin-like domain-containing protein n=1 Tax=Leptobrachium leishanense TaxID=445787 RepID=A0A8C5Q927_9ANUR
MDENDAVQYNLENDLNLEDVDEILPHAEITDIFQEGLAMLVQDPLLCDLPIQVTLEEINSQIALEFGQAMTVKICKASGEVMPVVIVQNATVLDLKRAIQRYIQLKHQREGGIQHISWFQVIDTVPKLSRGGDREKLLKNKDLYWIHHLKTIEPLGLNREFDLSPFL